ncbi:MAG: hypothetical protein LCH95_15270 [Proteobacteria bacterium]|nr:hypothetical protein [Pseudomonadota bacterium]
MTLLSGCGWFDGWFGGSPTPSAKARPGADRDIAPSTALPPAPGGAGVDSGATAVEEPTPAIGSVVPGKGGQKAQKEALEKEASERDAKARKERDEREAQEKAARAAEKEQEKAKGKPGAVTPAAATETPAAATPAAVPPPPAADSSGPVLPPIPPAAEPK